MGTVGTLLARARAESGRSPKEAGEAGGVTRGRIQQMGCSENIEVATLVRVAAACGYEVRIGLRPLRLGRRAFAAVLPTPATPKG